MKKLIILSLLISCTSRAIQAQLLHPVTWSYGAKKINRNEGLIFIRATIEKGWHIYSQTIGEGGPVKTSFAFEPSKLFQAIGKAFEPKPISRYEKVFGMKVDYFEDEVVFKLRIKLNSNGTVLVKGKIKYMACNDHQCLPPEEIPFNLSLKQ